VNDPLDGFGFVVPLRERLPILSGSFSSVKFAGRAPEDHVLFRVFIGGSARPDLVEADDETLFRVAESELRALLGIAGGPELREVVRWRQVMPQYEVGHLERVASIESRVAGIGGIGLAGNWLRGVGVPMCIHCGELAAERVAAAVVSPSGVG
jgi:oxygen-dependent protoporphyrinogen oxidase